MTLWIGRDVLSDVIEQGRAFHPLETGGVLLGWRDGADKIVVDVLGPGPRALHGRHALLPDHRWQIQEIRRIFEQTGGDLDYLGDWHTHPDGAAAMSEEDRRTLGRISRKVRGAAMLIAAGAEEDWRFGAWVSGKCGLLAPPVVEPVQINPFEVPSGWPRAVLS